MYHVPKISLMCVTRYTKINYVQANGTKLAIHLYLLALKQVISLCKLTKIFYLLFLMWVMLYIAKLKCRIRVYYWVMGCVFVNVDHE